MSNKTCFYKHAYPVYMCLFFNYCGNVTLLIKIEHLTKHAFTKMHIYVYFSIIVEMSHH